MIEKLKVKDIELKKIDFLMLYLDIFLIAILLI